MPTGRVALELYRPMRSLRPYSFELATAVVYLLLGVSNVVYPATLVHTPAGGDVEPLATVWSVFFIVGGVGMAVGLVRALPNLRVAGLILLAFGITMQVIAACSFDLTPRALAPLIYAAACASRAYTLTVMIGRVRNAAEA